MKHARYIEGPYRRGAWWRETGWWLVPVALVAGGAVGWALRSWL